MNMIHSENPDNPFSLKKKLTGFYSNPSLDQFFSVLINSIGGKDFLVLAVGESQSGKTTILSKLIAQLEQNITHCHLKIRESSDPSSENNKHPAFLYKTQNRQVIILDDAHKLNANELSIILKNAWDSDKETSQLILFCEPEINIILSSLLKTMPKKTSVNKLYIPNFDIEQTEDYLNHYLKESNLIDQFTFSKLSIKNIYKNSKGLPGKINFEAGEIYSKKTMSIKTKKPSQSFISPAFTIIILLLLFSSVAGFALYKKNIILSLLSSKKPVPEAPNPTITKKIPPSFNKKKPFVQPPTIKQKTNEKIFAKSSVSETNIPTTDSKESSLNIKSRPAPIERKPQLNKKPLTIKKTKKDISSKATAQSVILKKNWIINQEPKLYTLQVMATKDEDSIERFLKLNVNNKNETAYYKMYTKNGTWYKFISGRFKTIEKAKAASQNLPESLQKLGPWTRQFSSIQNDINAHALLIKKNKE